MGSWNGLLHCPFSRIVCFCDFRVEFFKLIDDAGDLKLNPLERLLFALLRVLTNQQHRRK